MMRALCQAAATAGHSCCPCRSLVGAGAQQVQRLHVAHQLLPLPQPQVHQRRLRSIAWGKRAARSGRRTVQRCSHTGRSGRRQSASSMPTPPSVFLLQVKQPLPHPQSANNMRQLVPHQAPHHHGLPVLRRHAHHQPKVEVAEPAVSLRGRAGPRQCQLFVSMPVRERCRAAAWQAAVMSS